MSSSVLLDHDQTKLNSTVVSKTVTSADLQRALNCPVCVAAGVVNHPPTWHSRTPDMPVNAASKGSPDQAITAIAVAPAMTASSKPRAVADRPTFGQAEFLRRIWVYCADNKPGSHADARLLALLCVLRAARTGKANVIAQDLTALRIDDHDATIAALTDSGWLDVNPETLKTSTSTKPAEIQLPGFLNPVNPWSIGKTTRTRASAWVTRILAHKLLRKQPNAVRIAAIYLTSYAQPDGSVIFDPDQLQQACAHHDQTETLIAVKSLVDMGWLSQCQPVDATRLHAQLAETVMALAALPAPPPEVVSTPSVKPQRSINAEARQLITGREHEIAVWVERFRAEHGHGPSWFAISTAMGWKTDYRRYSRDRIICERALSQLFKDGWLTGLGEPYGARPGDRYLDTIHTSITNS